jgi:hypothetical protein
MVPGMRVRARCVAGLVIAGCIVGLAPRALAQEPATATRVHFETATPETAFLVRFEDAKVGGWSEVRPTDDAPGYARVCTVPCDATLAAGTYRLALSQEGRSPLEPAEPVTIQGPSTVTGAYTSHRGLRIAGWSLMSVGVVVGSILAVAAATRAPNCVYPNGTQASAICGERPDPGPYWGAAAAFGAAAVVGLVLALQHDSASITVTPMNAGFLVAPPRREGAELTLPTGSAPGLGVVARW